MTEWIKICFDVTCIWKKRKCGDSFARFLSALGHELGFVSTSRSCYLWTVHAPHSVTQHAVNEWILHSEASWLHYSVSWSGCAVWALFTKLLLTQPDFSEHFEDLCPRRLMQIMLLTWFLSRKLLSSVLKGSVAASASVCQLRHTTMKYLWVQYVYPLLIYSHHLQLNKLPVLLQ